MENFRDTPIEDYNPVRAQKECEEFCLETEGLVALYAESQLTFEEYKQMFAPHLVFYDKMRKKYHCDGAFCHTYDKISKNGRTSMNDPKFYKDANKK